MFFRSWLSAFLAASGILIMILDGQAAFSGATAGMELCIKNVIPALFPFLFLCSILTDRLWGNQFRLMRTLAHKLGIPPGAESLLIVSFLGGYPAGAQAIGTAWQEHKLPQKDAERLLAVCNNAGPAFLFGMVSHQFQSHHTLWALWSIQILSSLLIGIYGSQNVPKQAAHSNTQKTLSQILLATVKTMGIICGWILMFRILSEFLTKWVFWCIPFEIQVLLTGILELSNGCCMLSQIQDEALRFLICSCLLSLGGICITMQTAAVIGSLSLKTYLKGKFQHVLMCMMLSHLYLLLGGKILAVVWAFIFMIPQRIKNNSGFSEVCSV